ncbi:hypothetical protein EDB89DRAFT_1903240 [Lactarius sanguifluus]|nr:hypothetical protein EDB89DRAFT_1903240 [Lactarius sanguifluus]
MSPSVIMLLSHRPKCVGIVFLEELLGHLGRKRNTWYGGRVVVCSVCPLTVGLLVCVVSWDDTFLLFDAAVVWGVASSRGVVCSPTVETACDIAWVVMLLGPCMGMWWYRWYHWQSHWEWQMWWRYRDGRWRVVNVEMICVMYPIV